MSIRPWQEELLAQQHETNRELLILCTKQQQMLVQFNKRLEARQERNGPLFEVAGASGDKPTVFTHDSAPVIWGDQFRDAVPIEIEGQSFTAMIFNPDTLEKWNQVLILNRRLNQCKELEEIAKGGARGSKQAADHRLEQLKVQGKIIASRWDDEQYREFMENHKSQQERVHQLQKTSNKVIEELRIPLKGVCCQVWHFLDGQGRLAEDNYDWLTNLRKEDSDRTKEAYATTGYDATKCPFEDTDLDEDGLKKVA